MYVNSTIFCILLFCILHSIATPVTAQVERGRLRLGGAFSASFDKSSGDINLGSGTAYTYDQDVTSIAFSPLGGIFLMDGLELGISPSVNWAKRNSETSAPFSNTSDSESINFQLGPYVNYYLGSGEKGKPFLGLSTKVGWGETEQDNFVPDIGEIIAVESNTKLWSISITGGYAIFLNDSYLLSFYAGYTFTNTSLESENDYSSDYEDSLFTVGVSISTTFKR